MPEVEIVLRGVDRYSPAFRKLERTVKGVGGTLTGIARTVRQHWLAFGAALGGIAYTAKQAMDAALELEDAYARVRTMTGLAVDVHAEFGEAVDEIVRTLPVAGGRVEVLTAVYQALSAGVTDTAEAIDLVTTAAKFARAGMTDMFTAVDALTTLMITYGHELKDATEAADYMFMIYKKGKITVADIAHLIGRVASVAATTGIRIDELSGMFAYLTRMLPPEEALTALNALIIAFIKPTETLERILAGIAAELRIVRPEFRETESMLQEARTAVDRLSYDFRTQENALVSLGMEYDRLSGRIRDLDGTMDDLSDRMDEIQIDIMEIRLRAREEGRELTREERAMIDELQLEQERLRLEYAKTARMRDEEAESLAKVEESIKAGEARLEEIMAAMKEYTGETADAIIKEKSFMWLLGEVTRRAKEQNIPFSELIANVRAMRGFLPLTTAEAEELEEVFEDMKDPTGAMSEAYEAMMTDSAKLTIAMNQLRMEWENFGKYLKDEFIPFATETLIPFLKEDLIPALKDLVGVLTPIADALKIIGRAWGVLGGLLAWAAPVPAVPPRLPPGAPPTPTPGTITNITAFTDINITGPAEPEDIERAVERGLLRGMEARR